MGLVVVDNNILVMEEKHCLAIFKSLKIDEEIHDWIYQVL